MKCYKCEGEASVTVSTTSTSGMVRSREITRFYCKTCFDKGFWKEDWKED
jgi:hypothetical protein